MIGVHFLFRLREAVVRRRAFSGVGTDEMALQNGGRDIE
jgi:hypothetical protein